MIFGGDMEKVKTDIEIVDDAPESAVTYCMYNYGDEMHGTYLNCKQQFFDDIENKDPALELLF